MEDRQVYCIMQSTDIEQLERPSMHVYPKL